MTDNMFLLRCSKCDEEFQIEKPSSEISDTNTSTMPIPNPSRKKKVQKYVKHDDHFVMITFDEDNVETAIILKQGSVIEGMIQNYLVLLEILNDYLTTLKIAEDPKILILSNSGQYINFVMTTMIAYIKNNPTVSIEYQDTAIELLFNKITVIMGKTIDNLDRLTHTNIASLVIDHTSFNQELVERYLRNKNLDVDNNLKTILAFNNRINTEIPLKLQEYLIEAHELTHIDLINYETLDGLKTVHSQSHFNLFDDELVIRDLYEEALS